MKPLRSDHPPSHSAYRPSKTTLLLALLAFTLMVYVNYRAVDVAGKGQDAYRDEAALARIELADAQRKLEALERHSSCVAANTSRALQGLLANSIFQDDLLLSSVEGTDRTAVANKLKETRAKLQELAAQAAATERDCG